MSREIFHPMKINNKFLSRFVAALCISAGCVLGNANAALFSSVTAADANAAAKVDSDVLKRRVVRVNFSDLKRHARIGAKIDINLFTDLSLTGTVDKVEGRSANNYTVSGHLSDDEFSTFTISSLNDVIAMNVRMADGKFYQVRFVQNGLHEVCQMDGSKFPGCGVKAAQRVPAAPVAADAAPRTAADAADIIDVMVVYTPAAKNAADPVNGNTNAIMAAINLAVSESNTAYEQSQVNTRIRLVYAGEVAYTESLDGSDFDTELRRLTDPGDGFLDEVQGLRDAYGADLVSLWINDSSNCGLAWVLNSLDPAFAAHGFSVVHWGPQCATGYYSFGHEMAHNMGCGHDREAPGGGGGLDDYSYGWHFTGTNGVEYRTIMAYSPGSRIQRFSNPNVNYLGTPTGVPIGDPNQSFNAQTINNSALLVANFRQSVVSTNDPPGSNSLGESVDNTGFVWSPGIDTPWVSVTNITHDGVDAAASGDITDLGYSSLQTTITGPGTLSFWWKVSSEENYDFLDVLLDSGLLDPLGISGDVDWTQRTFSIPAGTHTISWQYSKDTQDTVGADQGWVDQIVYLAGSSFNTNSLRMTNGQFRLEFSTFIGATYSLQASTNLIDWTTLTNFVSATTNQIYQDSETTNYQSRFYRVTSP